MTSILIRLLLLGLCLCCAGNALASRCAYSNYDSARSIQLFGPAERVFTGTLQRTLPIPIPVTKDLAQAAEQSEEPELEPISSLNASARDALGVFRVEQSYKGAGGKTIEVVIGPGASEGERYLVYALDDPQRKDGYVVDLSHCNPGLLPLNEQTQGMLAHLEHLPPAGSGGSISVQASFEQGSRPWSDMALRFAGPQGELLLRTDERGFATAEGVPGGTYRLLTAAPPEQSLQCPTADCAQFVVYDRGTSHWQLVVRAPAQLRIHLRDAAGNPTKLAAQFEILDALSGAVRESLVDMTWASSVEVGRRLRLQRGRVVVALLLVEVTGPIGQRMVSERRRIFSAGASFANAPRIDLQTGEQSFDFILPVELQPVLTKFQLIGELPGRPPNLMAQLQGGPAVGAPAERQWLSMGAAELWSLPGQMLELQVYNYRFIDNKTGVWSLRPKTSATVVLHIEPTTPH